MPVYEVTMYFHGHDSRVVTAKDEEQAEEMAMLQCAESVNTLENFEINDAVVVKSDDQYTDQQELLDREGPHES